MKPTHGHPSCIQQLCKDNMDSTSQTLTGVMSTEKQQNTDPVSWTLSGDEKSSPTTHQVDTYSWKLTGEGNSLSTIQVNVCRWEVDWAAHQDHQNGHSITEGDWGGHDPSHILWMDACSLKLIGKVMIQVPII